MTEDQAAEEREEAIAQLLAGIRDGAWLDAQEFPPVQWAVPGLIPEGFTILIGPPKAGKSWLVLSILLAMSSGGRALGKLPLTTKQRVLYLALEDGDRRMQDRCRQLLGGQDNIPALFTYVTKVQPGKAGVTIRAYLERYPDTALVVIDTLGKVMPPAAPGESSYQRDYRIGGGIKDIADRHPGLAIVVLHHDRKATADDFVDSVSGTHGLAGAADTIVVLARKRQATDGLLKITGRDVAEAEYAIEMQDGRAWVLDGDDLAEAAHRAREREEAGDLGEKSTEILKFIRAVGGSNVQIKAIKDQFGDDADVYVSRLKKAGRLESPRRGVYSIPGGGVGSVGTVGTASSNTSNGSNTPGERTEIPQDDFWSSLPTEPPADGDW
ncbi:AAA family ATPase [Micromonospora chersina]|uniref:AAA family ATPase n=1 Tax=Micromonospora chersina TaxID=47854 RepID=UPI0037A3FB2D